MTRMNLRDDQWNRIKDHLLGKAGDCGVTASDNRLFLEAVLWIARTGSPCRDLPECFGHWHRFMFGITGGATKESGEKF